jgi:hypothetical protein
MLQSTVSMLQQCSGKMCNKNSLLLLLFFWVCYSIDTLVIAKLPQPYFIFNTRFYVSQARFQPITSFENNQVVYPIDATHNYIIYILNLSQNVQYWIIYPHWAICRDSLCEFCCTYCLKYSRDYIRVHSHMIW